MNTAQARINRLFYTSGKCLMVACDHGMFNDPAFTEGLEDIKSAVDTVVKSGADALQLSPGHAHYLQELPGRTKPALVLRADVLNFFGPRPENILFSGLIGDPVECALRLDAACILVSLAAIAGQSDLHRMCVENVNRLKSPCVRYGMPLMIEPMVVKRDGNACVMEGDFEKNLTLVRQAAELGADIIKADPTSDVSRYADLVKAAGVPVLVRGGGKAAEDEVLKRTATAIKQGASGIVYGRNIIRHASPEKMTLALLSIVHAGATPEQAIKMMKG
jgi:DhnA family fructose-bisphosphate aldolase class Ia